MRVAGVSGRQGAQEGPRPTAATAPSRRSSSTAASRRCATDARAILRQKTLLGETYVELTPGTGAPRGPRERAPRRRRRSQDAVAARRDLPGASTRGRARRSASGSRTSAKGIEGRGPRPQRRARHAARLRRRRRRRARGARHPGAARCSGWSRTRAWCSARSTENEAQLRNLDHLGRPTLFDATAAQNGGAGRDDPHLPDLPRRVQGRRCARLKTFSPDTRPADPATCGPSPATSRRRCATCARFAPDLRAHLPRPRPADQGVARTACRRCATILDGHDAAARRARPVPRSSSTRSSSTSSSTRSQVADFISNGAARVADTTSSSTRRHRPLPAPDRPDRRRSRRRSGPERLSHQPRQLLLPAAGSWLRPPKAAKFLHPADRSTAATPAARSRQDNDEPERGTRSAAGSPSRMTFQGKLQGRFPHVERADYGKLARRAP